MSNYSPPSSRSSPNNPSNLSSTNSSSQLFGRKASLVERTTTAVIDKLTNSSSSQTGYLLRRTQTANASSSNLNSEPIVVGDNYSMNKEDYELGSAIGYGSSAVVYIAKYKPLNKNVAIKMIDLDMFERNQIDELRREIQIMSLSKHPNLLPVHGSFVNESKLYIVTPFLSAGSCLDIMKSAFPDGFEEAAIATILKQALQGLDYLHKNGLIHRDVKAGNLLVDDDGLVQLADFGVSSSLMDTGERRGNRKTFVGTPCWMAPEVMEQSGYDYKADIWSFGITALELSKGHAPYAKFPPMKVLLLTLQNDPPSLDRDATKHKYSKSFKDMIDTCLQKDPAKRPTAEKLLSHSFFKQGKKCSFLVQSILHNLGPIQQRAQNNRLPVKKLDNEGTGESWNFDSPVSSEEDLQKKVKFQSPTVMEPASYNTGLQMELGGESLNNSFSAPPNPNAVGKKSRFTTSTSTPTTSPPPENPTNNLPQTVPLASLNANSTLASKNSINVSTATLNAMINSGSLGPGSEMASNTPTGTANPANPVKKGRFTVNENTNLSASQSGSPSNTPVQAVVPPNSFTGLPQASPSTSVPPPNTLSGTDKKSRFLVSAVEGSTLWDPETQQQQQQQTTSNTHSPSPPSSIGRANSRFVTNTVRYEELSNTTTGISPPTTLLYQERIELLFKQNELQKQMLNEVVGALYKNTKASTDPNDKLQERDALTGLDIDTPIIDTNASPSQLLDNVRQMEKSFVTLLTQFEILRKENEKMRIENNGLRKEQENVRSDVESLKKLVNQLTSSAAGK